jgi:uncharacterized membrane protein
MQKRLATTMLLMGLALVAPAARAAPAGEIRVGDLPGTNGNWQFGEVTVNAPAAEVQRWFADVNRWPQRFPDVKSADVAGKAPDGREVVHFRSTIIGRPLTLRISDRPGLIAYDGEGKDVTTQGKIFVERLDDQHTHVMLQSSSQVHGAAGIFASAKMRRSRAQKKFRSDLSSIVRLSNEHAPSQHE